MAISGGVWVAAGVNVAVRLGEIMAAVWGVKTLSAMGAYITSLGVAQKQTVALGTESVIAAGKASGAWTAAAAKTGSAWSAASKLAMSAWVGWEIGGFLRDQFKEVEQAGIALAAGVHKTAVRARAGWEMIKAAFTDDTVAAAQGRLRVELERIDDEYAALFASAGKAKDAQQQQAAASQKSADALGEAKAKAAELVREFYTLRDGSEGVEGAIKKLAESLKFDSAKNVTEFVLALDKLRDKGDLSAQQFGHAWQQALEKLDPSKVTQLRSAQQLSQAYDQLLNGSLQRLGVNAAQAMGKISDSAQQAIDGIAQVADTAKAAGVSAGQTARALEMAFVAAIPKADSLEAITALETKLKEMGKAGEISAQGMERVQAALDKQKVSIEGQIPGIQSLQEALRELGVKPQAELDALAKKAKAAFDVIKASGTATPREVSEAWKAMAEASIAANNGVADAVLQAQASQQGFVIETDKAGKAIVKSMQEAAEATKGVGDAAKAAGEAAAEGAAAATEATDRFARDASGQVLKLEGTWLDAEAAASNYSAQVAEMVYSLNKPLELMRQEHLAMVRSLEALDAAQQRLQSNGASSVDDLRLRLLELNGTEEQIAEARQRREIAEVERNKRLMEIQLKRARMLGNEEDVAAAEFELQMLNEQLKLLEQIHKEEDKQRDAAYGKG